MRFSVPDHPIRTARKRARLTLATLGEASKIHPSKLSLLENGLVARQDELCRLAGVLGCHPAALIPKPQPVEIDAAAAADVRAIVHA